MPIGYRMGGWRSSKLDVEREKDHGLFVFPELGEGHPQTCMMDGIQVATGATYGKVLMSQDLLRQAGRASSTTPTATPCATSCSPTSSTRWASTSSSATASAASSPPRSRLRSPTTSWAGWPICPDETVFRVQDLPDFTFEPVKGSFNKTKCSSCGEYVFDRYVRIKDGEPMCIPCSGYEPAPQQQ